MAGTGTVKRKLIKVNCIDNLDNFYVPLPRPCRFSGFISSGMTLKYGLGVFQGH